MEPQKNQENNYSHISGLNNNETLPTSLPPMEGQQKEIQYPVCHKDTTGKGLWSGENDEVS